MRTARIRRRTAETDITLSLTIEGTGKSDIATGCGFLDHMLTLFARHGRFDLAVTCQGDTYIDDHHTVEDIAICLGDAFAEALGDKRGITRYASTLLPMDEALAERSGASFVLGGPMPVTQPPSRRCDLDPVRRNDFGAVPAMPRPSRLCEPCGQQRASPWRPRRWPRRHRR